MIHCLCSIKHSKSCPVFASGMWFHLFYVVYSFSSCWVKFIFVKKLLLYRVSITSLTTDHPSSASLLEESMIFFFSDCRHFPSSSNVELFLFARNKMYYMTQEKSSASSCWGHASTNLKDHLCLKIHWKWNMPALLLWTSLLCKSEGSCSQQKLITSPLHRYVI